MHLCELRNLLANYDRSWYNYFKSFFFSEPDEITQVRRFLREFETKDGTYLFSAQDFFQLLQAIPINSELGFTRTIIKRYRPKFLEIYITLANADLMSEQNFSVIHDYGLEKQDLVYKLFCDSAQSIRLTAEILDTVLIIVSNSHNSRFRIEQCLTLLNSKNYLTEPWLNLFKEKTDELCALGKIIIQLDKVDCLNEDVAANLSKQKQLFKLQKLLKLLNSLAWNNPTSLKEAIACLLSLPDTKIRQLEKVADNLNAAQLLDQPSFELALLKISSKLPPVIQSSLKKNSRKESKLARSEVTIDDKISFFIQTDRLKEYDGGAFGIVKRGYPSETSMQTKYSFKKFLMKNYKYTQNQAKREVKHNLLLGRKAFYTGDKKTYVIAEWQSGRALDLFDAWELQKVPFLTRLRCLRFGLHDLNSLHQHYRIHGDITCTNFILDLSKFALRLIDFGSSHRKGSSKVHNETMAYHDPCIEKDHFCNDIYAMGFVIMYLFPEIYELTFIKKHTKINIKLKKFNFTIKEQAIVDLVKIMMSPNAKKRCSSEDALNYCDELINNFSNLDAPSLEKIMNTTISRSNITLEDVFRKPLFI